MKESSKHNNTLITHRTRRFLSITVFALFSTVFSHTTNAEPPLPRIVAGDGSLTEIVYALNREDLLVGVDTTSRYPLAATKLPQIGYKRNISAEGVLSLQPQILIVTEDSGPEKILTQIEAAGVTVERYSATPNLQAVKQKIMAVATLVDRADEGKKLWQSVQRKVDIARQGLDDITTPVKVLFILSMQSGNLLVGGENTHAAEIIRLAGGINATKGFSGYKPMPLEAVIAAQPDIVLMMDRKGDHGPNQAILSGPGFMLTPAGQNKRLVTMDGMLMLGFGPRIGDAISQLTKAFYPNRKQGEVTP